MMPAANVTLSFSLLPFLLLLVLHQSAASSALCNGADLPVLLVIQDSFNVPNPLPSWNPDTPCCQWYGIQCDETTGRVTQLDFSGNINITGPVPPAIADLPALQLLRLHKLPNLHSPIPRAFTKLKNLRSLTVSWAALTGPIPDFLSQLSALQQLDLSFNLLSGSIPPSLGDLPALYSLDLSRNQLTGTVPASLFENKKNGTTYLDLSHNNLSGTVPRALGEVDFTWIDLSRNQLAGDGSFLFGKEKRLQRIVLSRNWFQFDLSKVEFPEKDLFLLQLEHNEIYGSIPEQIANVRLLQFLNVSYNRLCGEIPAGGRLGLREFDKYSFFQNKCLCGAPLEPCK